MKQLDKLFASIIVLWGAYTIAASAQQTDSTVIECTYSYSYLRDTTARMSPEGIVTSGDSTAVLTETMILYCGGPISTFLSHKTMVADSIKQARRAAGDKSTRGIRYGTKVTIYKDFRDKRAIMTDRLFADTFRITEDTPDFGWKILDEWKEIEGYRARQAVCTFRGRDYVAWFTPDIPIMDGPWKFCGLPGLILEVYDEPCQYLYRITGIRNKQREVTFPEVKLIDTDIRKYYRSKRLYLEDSTTWIENTYGAVRWLDQDGNATDAPERKRVPLKYDFQEIL